MRDVTFSNLFTDTFDVFLHSPAKTTPQPAFTSSELTKETLEQVVEYVQS